MSEVADAFSHFKRGRTTETTSFQPMGWGLPNGHRPFNPLPDQSYVRRLDAPQSIGGSLRALQASWMTA